ncbi:MAG: GGDEF domain-containing protein [Moorellaceae bacterium]
MNHGLISSAWKFVWLLPVAATLFFALSSFSLPAFFFALALAAFQVLASLGPRHMGKNNLLVRWTWYGVSLLLALLWLYYGRGRGAYWGAVLAVPLMALGSEQLKEALTVLALAVTAGLVHLGVKGGPDFYGSAFELGGWAAVSLVVWCICALLSEKTRLAAERAERLQFLERQYREAKMRLAEMEYWAITDHLTQLYNHRYFEQSLEKMLQDLHSLSSITLLMIDIDHFKEINDKYGHLVGNRILGEVGSLLKRQVREKDVVARYGGEEFALLLPGVDYRRARQVAERIRKGVEEHVFACDQGLQLRLTVSIGMATWPQDARNKTELLSRADAALYRAKNAGRNTVCAYQVGEQVPEH